jgi:hypothetical protein
MSIKPPVEVDESGKDTNIQIPFGKLLLCLFFNPSVFIILQHRKVLRSLLLIIILCFASSSIITCSFMVSVKKSAAKWEEWLKTDIQEFGITPEGSFFWKLPSRFPYVTHIDGWQIEINDESRHNELNATAKQEDKGLQINRKSIQLWYRLSTKSFWTKQGEDRIEQFDLGKLLLGAVRKETSVIVKSTEIAGFIDKILISIGIMLFFSNIFTVSLTVLIFPLCSASLSVFLSYILRSYDQATAFSKLLVLNLYATIPPILIATIYAMINVPGLSFFAVFFIAFFAYQLYVMNVFRRLVTL